jgi:hypothetical protein
VAALALLAPGCTGTEHTVLRTLDLPEVVAPPGGGAQAGQGSSAPPPPRNPLASPAEEPVEEPPQLPAPAELDPDARFEWTQSLPGRGTCRAGVYVGAFQCVTDGLPVLITGQVTLTLAGSPESQLLTVLDGRVGDLAGELFDADVEGELDCVDRHFHATTLGGIAYTVPQGTTPLPFVPAFQGFEASMFGALDDQELVVGGSWLLSYELGGRCIGTWHASAQP